MFFFFTFGANLASKIGVALKIFGSTLIFDVWIRTNFNSLDSKYQSHQFYCPHCHNNSVSVVKVREFFTFCFIPVIPTNWGTELKCSICQWSQSTNETMINGMLGQQPPVNGSYHAGEAMSYPSNIQRPAMAAGK
ncbi:hypothetical protein NADFUDRAFT_77591 [Nadsonia fulvescens var. elongata DSM 6958]|uniref:Uncharacterized protein n=1 Tax=Nadsonia fulvescens var. elongata DSM 6958 TaxID=857566 RepID=A0A1E3PQX3_9ASCO|nr:hypothetical protein NADFUDRAFT_77591 [Nadsonia fulvescens var. elongata DSM 6958]